ncbi:hypothetical protein ES703_106479 [subsurface metagenome]
MIAKPISRKKKMAATGITTRNDSSPPLAISSILRLPVVKYRLRIPASIKALPNKVYTTYFIAEYSLLPVPQMVIRKYIGIISISQKRKNSSRSREQNTPRMLVSRSRSQAKYSRGLKSIFHEMRTTRKPRKVISISKGRLRPSTPR